MRVYKLYRVLIIAFLTFIASGVSAIPYQVGDYRIDVTVRNSAMNLIPDVKVSFWRLDQASILIEARATGYKAVEKRIDIKPNQYIYKFEMMLPDLERKLYVIDHNQKILAAAYLRTDQFGFPGNEYGITAYIPIEMWEPDAKRVEVFDSFWGSPLKKTCVFEQVEGFHKVSLSITRKALKWSGSNIYVIFRTKDLPAPNAVARHLRQLDRLSANPDCPPGSEEALTAYIYENYAADAAALEVELPAVYERYQSVRTRFSELHRE